MPRASDMQGHDAPRGSTCRPPCPLRQHPRPHPSHPLMALVRRCRRQVALLQPQPPQLLPLALQAVLPPPLQRPVAPGGMVDNKAEA